MRVLSLLITMVVALPVTAEEPADPGIAFFESKVRPVLVAHCYKCHSAEAKKSKGGLLLDHRAAVLKGGDNGPAAVPGKPAESPLIKAIRYTDPDLRMPPDGKLPAEVIADLETWVARGLPDPRQSPTIIGKNARDSRSHWAFQPIRRPQVPAVKSVEWVRNPIDAFVLQRLEVAGLTPAPSASKTALFRRITFDLVGLPPTPAEIRAFCEDHRPTAYDDVVDRLLTSPHHGERWARHWLDVVRYADSAGYELDTFYAFAFHYRDYVIRAFNSGKAFDRFLEEQIAGDELWTDSDDARTATGFCTVGPYAYEGGIARPKVVEYQRLTDLVDTVGSAALGLTLGCARCHDHKSDPFSQADYFGLQAIFAASEFKDVKLGPSRSKEQLAVRVLENRKTPPPTHVLRRGELDAPGDEVSPALPRALPGGGTQASLAQRSDGRRAALARWLTSSENPLTARVIANRVWQWHFGKALVRTPNDFGVQGESPTHPELLDYLADELRSSGWDLRHLHRLIVQSNTYRMASRGDLAGLEKDPDNRLFSRFPRRRLEAEAIWDNLHAAAGTLNPAMFGPPVVPPVDADALKTLLNANWKVTPERSEWTRRGIYLVVRRSLVLPLFDAFNAPRSIESCARRESTVVTSQALTLLNSEAVVGQARAFAGRLLREFPDDGNGRIEHAWLLAFGRPPCREEMREAHAFLERRESALRSGQPTFVPIGAPEGIAPARAGAVAEWCLALVNANEFLYVD
jgi:hypothetical protein